MYVCDMSAKKCYWARKFVRQMRFNVYTLSETWKFRGYEILSISAQT